MQCVTGWLKSWIAVVGLAVAWTNCGGNVALGQGLHFDLIPSEYQRADGRYQPLRKPLTIPEVASDEVICFCLYTTHRGVLKLNAQLYPLGDDASKDVKLFIKQGGDWDEVQTQTIAAPSWNAIFRVEDWDDSKPAWYRVTHFDGASYEGIIRKNPIDKDEIVVGNLSCNSSTDRNLKPDLVANLKAVDPDLLFFAGDQSYDHTQHLAAWLLFGRQFGDAIKDRPTVTIPDDHDVGHPNIWGEAGGESKLRGNADGGYAMPVSYVNMVQRQQTGHLPDPYDSTPVRRGITVYYTSLNVGGIDFAILEDRKFKSGPAGLIPQQGPRPDHINNSDYDRQSIDVPEAVLLGKRQLQFLDDWTQSWQGSVMKCVLSQTPFAGAAHLHGGNRDRLLADLDSNGWPQSGRNRALTTIRKGFAFMMSGDQHLATVIHQGVNSWGDSGWQFTSPSIWNLYGRVWDPLEENTMPLPDSVLPDAGNFYDGFGNKLTMAAYVNPTAENYQGTGFGVVRFSKSRREITMECWPRFVDVTREDATQYPGFPITVSQESNYGREARGWLPTVRVQGASDPVIQVVDEVRDEVVYTLRIQGDNWLPKVFQESDYTIRVMAEDRTIELKGIASTEQPSDQELVADFSKSR